MPITEVTTQDVTLRIKVLDDAGNFLGGKVDIEFKHRTLGESAAQKGLDASREIAISGLRRAPQGAYQVTVTPSDRFDPQSQFGNIPASGAATMEFNFRKQTSEPPQPPVPQPPTPDPSPVLDNQDIALKISALNPQGGFLGGKVNLEFKHRTLAESAVQKDVDASQEISVKGLRRAPVGDYQVTVTPSDHFDPQSQFVTLPASGVATMQFTFADHGSTPPSDDGDHASVIGRLFLDYGLPAIGATVRLYSRGFAGADTLLAESKTGNSGAYALSYAAPAAGANVEVRIVDAQGQEIAVSATKFDAGKQEELNLVAPGSAQPLAPEFQRLSADMDRHIGGIAKLSQAQENDGRQDLKFASKTTGWDARLLALAATAGHQTAATGMAAETLYSLYRFGLPTDAQHLAMVPAENVKAALGKAAQAGITGMSDQQITVAVDSFQTFAARTRLSLKSPGGVSSFEELLPTTLFETAKQRDDFANLYFNSPNAGGNLWQEAAKLNIPPATIDTLKLQGKLLYLTSNNGPLANALQKQIGSLNNLAQMVDKDFHTVDTWKKSLTDLAGAGGDAALDVLVPKTYPGKTASERLEPYAADLARKVRISFPAQVTARMIDKRELPLDQASAGNVSAFLKAAATSGYELGRTPLNTFLKTSPPHLPAMDAAATQSLKTLHRLYQVTPSFESLNTVLGLGFTSAFGIAYYRQEDFLTRFGPAFPSRGEAILVHGKAQQIKSVTFNFFSLAKQLDTAPPIYGLSGSADDRQSAKNSIVKQFPSMENLFGSMDFCQCDECHSVLSPAAYFVDALEFLRQSATNTSGYTPLDVLVGKDNVVKGRRPDLAVLPLSCENTNTAMPYIDLVNEIFEYYIANSHLDAQAAYDTGDLTTADLAAEPQHILQGVYSDTLKRAVYPRRLPFDLWIETVRGFLGYFDISLAQVLDVMSPAEDLELFTDAHAYPYYRAQIFAESLGISPAEYRVLTVNNEASPQLSAQNWFKLYGYASEALALNGQLDATDLSRYEISPLKSAKNLAQRLGVSYQELADLVSTGFLNPALNALIFQFKRFNISMADAFSYTAQAGYDVLSAPATVVFEAHLDSITQQYKNQNPASTFDAKAWLNALLADKNYSRKTLVLHDPDAGCNFSGTTLQYASGGAAEPLDLLRLNLLVRLWKKLGWTLEETDRALQLFFPSGLPLWSDGGFGRAFSEGWKTALVYLSHLNDLAEKFNPTSGRTGLLPLWSNLSTLGANPLYAHLFLTPGVLNNDGLFDDAAGQFPSSRTDAFAQHQDAVQGVLGLSSDDVAAVLKDADANVTMVTVVQNGQNVQVPGFSLVNLSICYRYSLLAKCLQMPVTDLIALKAMSGIDPFQTPWPAALTQLADDRLWYGTVEFAKRAAAVQASGLTVEDLKYLLRHQFDPVGKYQIDSNALMSQVQSVTGGLRQIAAQNAAPANLLELSEDLIEQKLSALLPAPVLKALFAHLAGSRTYEASQNGVGPGTQINPASFAQEAQLSFSYDATSQVQKLSFKGVLLDWKKTELMAIDNSALFVGLLNRLQQQTHDAFSATLGDILGVWASLAEYEAVQTGVAAGLTAAPLVQKDAALSLSYDQAGQLQWLGYRGVLTDVKMSDLTNINASPTLLSLLNDVQRQAMPAYRQLAGRLLAMWSNTLLFRAVQVGLAPANQLSPSQFTDYPAIRVSYDAATTTQTLRCQGVLTEAQRVQLTALVPASASLLLDVRNQTLQFFLTQATGLLAVTPADLDDFVEPFLSNSKAQRRIKGELITAFQPLLADKLARQLVMQTLSASLDSEPLLTESLMKDAGLLTAPSIPGKSLLKAFLAVRDLGVSVTYYDGGGASLADGTAVSVDTNDATNPNAHRAGTGSAHFEGYLQVPADGPYRFFAELGNAGAQVTFSLDSPVSTVLFKNPVLQQSAAADNQEASQFVELQSKVPYHFVADFKQLGISGASLLVQGENLPKGSLSQIVLYPQAAVEGFVRARTLLAKVLQILRNFGMDQNERELGYLTANAAQFSNLNLSALPTHAGDDSLARAVQLFAQFMALAAYADLREGPAGGTDGLVDVFENAGKMLIELAVSQDTNLNSAAPWRRLANLTRRNPRVVRDAARALGMLQEQLNGVDREVTAIGDFGNNKGIRRIWRLLQLVQVLGIPVSSLAECALITCVSPPAGTAMPGVIAANIKNAVKARYTPEVWRPIAKSVFDKLRQKKRDALVDWLVDHLKLENSVQLFEYFLVDPGMEPVVQTSRLRLAMSSVQTFIQRCLLNLENGNTGSPETNVSPSAIKADWWEWMKRYRVWQANREIFLFAENWMEPEMRMDKSDLFQALESTLLQGDVTTDLVEDAFLAYLKGLEVRARLDVVAMYLDQDATRPGLSTLHVIGRTYGVPHKYFYRTYANESWSAWEAVTPDIEGDHITLVVWRGRVNLFWVTFMPTGQPPSSPAQDPADTTAAASLPFSQLASRMFSARAKPQVKVQLHWAEYFQGKWSDRISTDMARYDAINVSGRFNANKDVYIHVSKEMNAGEEGAVRIHLDFTLIDDSGALVVGAPNYAFRVTSKNCQPDLGTQYWETSATNPYNAKAIDATLLTGSGLLQASFNTHIASDGTVTPTQESILHAVNNFALLRCANPVVPTPFLDPGEPRYQEAGALVSPFFFKDTSHAGIVNELTFFVQPSLTETTIREREGWAISPIFPDRKLDYVKIEVPVLAQVPHFGPIDPGDLVFSLYQSQPREDWVINPRTAIAFRNTWIHQEGAAKTPGGPPAAAVPSFLDSMGFTFVGSQGLNLGQLQNITSSLGGIFGNIAAIEKQNR